jgi:CubicO group peptidase (beta-lactamase class C family)
VHLAPPAGAAGMRGRRDLFRLGPGRGPWARATPESQGLSLEALQRAEELTNVEMGEDRLCMVVIKNGKLVYERYRRGHTESSTYGAWSATKSLCSSLFGVAVQQGWADPDDLVRDRNSGTRECNAETTFRHVMTMTGFSDPSQPEWVYDGDGDLCLDTLADFVEQNNPEGLSGSEWKEKYYWEALGMEDSVWTAGPDTGSPFSCGWGVEASCRDLARAGLLWANDGEWAGEGRLMDPQFTADARRWIYPGVEPPYGYLAFLRAEDPVDAGVAEFLGAGCQSVFVSHEHQAVIVSMGDFGFDCEPIW